MKKLLLTITLFIITINLIAQDAAFSQFYANRVYLNPALAGSQGGLTLSSSYRSQWNYVPGGFNTYSVAADIQEPYIRSALGFIAVKDIEGEGLLTTTSAGFIYSYILKITNNADIHIGFKTNFVQKSVDWSKFTFTDQLDPVLGIVRPTTALPILETKNYADFDGGIVARFMAKINGVETDNSIGFAVHHLTQPDESLQEIEQLLPRRYTFHIRNTSPIISFNYSKRRVLYLSTNFKIDYQKDIKVVTYGLYAVSNPLYFGVLYQNKNGLINQDDTNSLIFTGGIEGRLNDDMRFTMGYSYDLNATGLGTRVEGVHEITFMVNFETASIFGLPRQNSLRKKGENRRSGRRKSQKCYRFKGKNAILSF